MMAVFVLPFLLPVEEWLLRVLWSLGVAIDCIKYMLNICLVGWPRGKMFRFYSVWNFSTRASARLSLGARGVSSLRSDFDPNSLRLRTLALTLWGMTRANTREQTVFSTHRMEILLLLCPLDLQLEDFPSLFWSIYCSSLQMGQHSWSSTFRPTLVWYLTTIGLNCALTCCRQLRAFQETNSWVRLSLRWYVVVSNAYCLDFSTVSSASLLRGFEDSTLSQLR